MRDVVAAGVHDGADHVERLIAVERRDLDRHHTLDFRKSAPERVAERTAADGGLQVEADQRHDLGEAPAVRDQLVV